MLSPEARGLTNVFPGLGQAVQGGSGGPDRGLDPATELCVNFLSFRCPTSMMVSASSGLVRINEAIFRQGLAHSSFFLLEAAGLIWGPGRAGGQLSEPLEASPGSLSRFVALKTFALWALQVYFLWSFQTTGSGAGFSGRRDWGCLRSIAQEAR